MRAYRCDYCKQYEGGPPISSLKLYANDTPFDFDSLICQAMWMVEQLKDDDLTTVSEYARSQREEQVFTGHD
jgi:hypothetical protein